MKAINANEQSLSQNKVENWQSKDSLWYTTASKFVVINKNQALAQEQGKQ